MIGAVFVCTVCVLLCSKAPGMNTEGHVVMNTNQGQVTMTTRQMMMGTTHPMVMMQTTTNQGYLNNAYTSSTFTQPPPYSASAPAQTDISDQSQIYTTSSDSLPPAYQTKY